MATSAETISFFLEQLEGRGVTARKMFGEYGVYAGGKMVALICDDTLFVKQLPEAAAYLGAPEEAPPYKGAKPHFRISADQWEDGDWLWGLISLMETHLPMPKPKARKPKREG
ncbi:TfoX/Sxy family transcriptional regulator of competence genes [Rhodobacter aestuarii]|uniref:Transcriptional regulator of competence genes, TfoX/Sxy family n=1 Tax=Rhodobacter aestuarii TaxID=453582 RepID=A0A1N7MUS5_9RHOB|nr:TfoX/Sxy family protein [Rhodobacter aestuarii]PTV96513.1 TfoX/Sxy family transcriptional regulator of competence genes [Rhodobacter aestuarii]SIS89894.1 Transcriptional regulator of competence genes, TfoX/Sxy family [Rhodobacter aestuarii]